jgi:hypothetical protein
LKSFPRKFYRRHLDFANRYGISVSQITTDTAMYAPFVIITIHSFSHSWRITWFVTRWMPLVKQKLFILPEQLRSPLALCVVRLVFSVVSCISLFVILFCFVFSNFSCTVCCMSAITVNKLVFAITTGLRYAMVIVKCSNIRSNWNTTKPEG